jgi:hypothetical protein
MPESTLTTPASASIGWLADGCRECLGVRYCGSG